MTLQPTENTTGTMSQTDLNKQDISNLLSEVTKLTDANNGVNRTVTGYDVYYDSTGTPRILIGQAPGDGRMGIWVSKTGLSVLTLLGG